MSTKLEDGQECLANSECLHGSCQLGKCVAISEPNAYCSPDADHCAKGSASAALGCSSFSHRCVPLSEASGQAEANKASCERGYDCPPDAFCSPETHACCKRKTTGESCVMVTMDRMFEEQCLDGLFCDNGVCKEVCKFDPEYAHVVMTGNKMCKQLNGSFGVWVKTQDAPDDVLWILGKLWVIPVVLLLVIAGLFVASRLRSRSSPSS